MLQMAAGLLSYMPRKTNKKKPFFFKKSWIFLTNQQNFLGSTLKRCPWPQKQHNFTNGRHLVTADSRNWNIGIPDSRWLALPEDLSPTLLLKRTSFYSNCSYGTRETATRLRAAESEGVWIPTGALDFLSSSKRQDRPWDPSRLVFEGYRNSFQEKKKKT